MHRKFYQELRIDLHQCPQCRSKRVYVLDQVNIGYYKTRLQERLHCANRFCNYEWYEDLQKAA